MQTSLSELLNELAGYGNIVHKLNQFIEKVSMGDDGTSFGGVISQTYQAYSATLSTYLHGFKMEIVNIEKMVLKQGKGSYSLAMLTLNLRQKILGV